MSDGSGEGAGPANPPQDSGVQATLFTQDQVNHFVAQGKRGATTSYFKDLGFEAPPSADEMKATLEAAAEYRKLQEGQKSDNDRLTGELASEREKSAKIPGLETQLLRQRLAGDALLPTRFWKFVEGKTDDEITESIKGLKQELNLPDGGDGGDGGEPPSQPQRQGTGALQPNPQQGSATGRAPAKTMATGREAYEKKHKRE